MARQLNGSTQYLERTSAVVSSFPLTISCWMYLASTTAEQIGLCLYHTTGINNIQFDYVNSSIGWRAFAERAGASSTSQYRSNVTGTIGWYGLAASWATYTQVPNFWINGAKVTGGTTFTGAGGTMTLSRTGVGSYLFNAVRYNTTQANRYAYCAMWNAELTDAEMKALTQTTPRHPLFIRRASLQACWDFGGHFGENDLSRVNNNDLTPTASPTWAEQPSIIYPRVANLPQRAASAGGATPWLYARRRSQIIGAGGVH